MNLLRINNYYMESLESVDNLNQTALSESENDPSIQNLEGEQSEQGDPLTPEQQEEQEVHSFMEKQEKVEALAERVNELSEKLTVEQEKIAQVRESLGLAPDDNIVTSSQQYLEELQAQQKELENTISNEENKLLGIPEEYGPNDFFDAQNENFEGGEGIDEERLDSQEEMEKDSKEDRKEFIDKFILEKTAEMLELWDEPLSKCMNKEKAISFIKIKFATSILEKTETFIENGEKPFFKFEAILEMASFPDRKGNSVMYMNGFDLVFYDEEDEKEEIKAGEDDKDKINLYTPEDLVAMKAAERKGDLEVEEVKPE